MTRAQREEKKKQNVINQMARYLANYRGTEISARSTQTWRGFVEKLDAAVNRINRRKRGLPIA